ncbi:OsmC family protein [Myroides sp. N17-2]|uniref:OsmC family protein n=1 Tax=Myroides sp. N17-2 TaxID=2030799 RepID=UPI000EFCBA54|nr:OsmC family protein [Myroides sp. N17-2]
MGNKVLKVLGFSVRDQQFAVKTANYSFTVKDGRELVRDVNADSGELLLAKLAGSIHAVGSLIGNTLGLNLKSIQVEVSGEIKADDVDKANFYEFNKVEVVVKPTSEASIVLLKEWIDAVKSACPMFANFNAKTPTIVTLVKEYDQVKVA